MLSDDEVKNLFLKNHAENVVDKLVPDPQAQKMSISLDQQSKMF